MKKFIGLGLVIVAALAACNKNGAVVAKIGSDKITVKMLQERMQDAPPAYQSYLATNAGKKQFLDLMVRERVVIDSARAAGYDKKDDYKKAVAEFRKEQARRIRDYEENMLMELYVRDLHDAKQISPTDADVEKYYKEHLDEYTHPKEITARHILLATRAEAEAVRERLKQGADFAKLAQEISTDPISAARGGQIGPFQKGQLVPEFESAVFPLKKGQISEIVETQFGYHIITKMAERPLPARSFEEVKPDILKLLEKTKFDTWYDQAKKKQGVTVNYEALNTLAQPAAAASQSPADGKTNPGAAQ
jgi:parvulin-like peptidyl-prolyl isomerase